MSTLRINALRALGIAGVALATTLAVHEVALADTAQTPVGQLTSTLDGCNDLGAQVYVAVSGGQPNTVYTASTAYGFDHDDTFTTDGSGNGLGYLHNAWADVHPTWSGQAVITVAANGQTGTVTVQINCPDPKGE
ncbi:hypothetical protein Cme02nite_73690 [Catellatospora methionotrophica]|uniref:Uncharacterized protein n=1 Tax=Catellatospora methionotrophica TaxID=121620 RepID=A0A8J3PJ28_9ACTN|nr:hypothetical protein [Catellatospora methionotrophica]GIG19037.1 hypothetical protein Cme02nite_73690 [Catellatospora methionotrophica]